ncbi:glycosyltransferase family 2 protein, partial [Escherichia coli]
GWFMCLRVPCRRGSLLLASVCRCPGNLMSDRRQHGRRHFHCETFADPLLLPRGERQQALQNAIDHYAARLEHYALQSPLDWFNFFDFWQLPEIQDKE